jgi:hypothetical protein
VLNISERGLSLQAIGTMFVQDVPKIRFQFTESSTWVETEGRIAWTSDSRKVAGVEFVDLSPVARSQIRAWLSSRSSVVLPEKGSGRVPEREGNPGAKVTLESVSTAAKPENNAAKLVETQKKNPILLIKGNASPSGSERLVPVVHSRSAAPIFSEMYSRRERSSKAWIFTVLAVLLAVASSAFSVVKPNYVREMYGKLKSVVSARGSTNSQAEGLPNSHLAPVADGPGTTSPANPPSASASCLLVKAAT